MTIGTLWKERRVVFEAGKGGQSGRPIEWYSKPSDFIWTGGEKVAAIQDQRTSHDAANARPIENAKVVPFRENKQGVCFLRSLIGIAAGNEGGVGSMCVREGLRIKSGNASASGYHALVKLKSGGRTDVVCTGFVSEPEESDFLVF
jgi:hypothetical protein